MPFSTEPDRLSMLVKHAVSLKASLPESERTLRFGGNGPSDKSK
jgi:hypothetical protein